MVEYGNGIGQGPAGQVGGGASGGGQTMDVGASVGRFVGDSVHTLSTLPPAELLLLVGLVFLGLFILRRAF